MFVCVCVRACLCMYVCASAYTYASAYAYAYAYARTTRHEPCHVELHCPVPPCVWVWIWDIVCWCKYGMSCVSMSMGYCVLM